MDPDFFLIWNMKRGDHAAMDTFVRRYYPVILRYCQYRLNCREDAEDLTQDTFVRFFAALPTYAHRGKALNYLYTIAGNLCRDYYRSATNVSRNASGTTASEQRIAGHPADPEQMSADALPTDQIDSRIDLTRALQRLPEELREIIILCYFQDLKQTDAANILGIGLPLVKYRIR